MTAATVTQPKKESKMATIDLTKLSYADALAQRNALDAVLAQKKTDELKSIVSGFSASLEANGFTVDDAMNLLNPTAKSIVSRPKAKAAKAAKGEQPVWGATYKNPATGETWTKAANGKGRAKDWANKLIEGGAKWADFEVK